MEIHIAVYCSICLHMFSFFLFKKKAYYFKTDSPVLCKRSITYQDVCLLDGDRPYDTFIHFQINKMHLLLYISFICSLQHATLAYQLYLYTTHIIHIFNCYKKKIIKWPQ